MTPAWTLRPAVAADLPFLLELRLATMAPQFARQGILLSADEHRRRAEFRLDAASIIEVGGQSKQNPAARLYARLGFVTLGESENSFKMTWVAPEAR